MSRFPEDSRGKPLSASDLMPLARLRLDGCRGFVSPFWQFPGWTTTPFQWGQVLR
jgi:hypothetical protein